MGRSVHVKIIATLIISMLLIVPCHAGEKEDKFIKSIYSDLSKIKYFMAIEIFRNLDESYENIPSLSYDNLINYLKLKYLNNLASTPIKKAPAKFYILPENQKKEYGLIFVTISILVMMNTQ